MKFAAALVMTPLALAAPGRIQPRAAPTVVAPAAQATVGGKSLLGVETFNSIPFAQPPIGQLRLKPPQPITSAVGNVDGTTSPRACPQFFFSVNQQDFPTNVLGTLLNTPLFQTISNAGEDCLTLNVQRPAGTTADSKLPVLLWIFGGGGKPIVFVAVNYRVGGFGFMPGKEILADGSANLGLLDQRLGMQWVADNIAAFGGDPDKVTIWGESAGSLSVMDQMLLYDGDISYKGKNLFRGGIMNSGSIVPTEPVDSTKAQAIYDTVVEAAGCSGSSDTLGCLRTIPYTQLLQACNTVPGILGYATVNLSYLPRPDHKVLTDSPDALVSSGKYAKVPFIVGDQEDEGTLFGLFTPNLTTTAQVSEYFAAFFEQATPAQLDALVATYPDTTEDGSPFRTGLLNNWYPQFKRVSAIIGDLTFTLTRRIFLETATAVNPTVPSWSYLSSYGYGTPILGTLHGSDIIQVFYGTLPNNASSSIRGYYYSFVYNLDPNEGNNLLTWPQWIQSQQLMNFKALSNGLISDDFRADTATWIRQNIASLKV
ncbi:hypothetical protein ACEQ8H_006431 [Pleosporales sp. CAS-2024a]